MVRGRRRVAVVAGLTALLLVLGLAFAAWLATGNGLGGAKAGVAQPMTATAGTPTSLLYPGGVADVALSIANPNPYPVRVTGISGVGPITSDKDGCEPGTHSVTFADQTGAWNVPPDGTLAVVLPGVAAMGDASPDACQGATFSIPLAIVGASGSGSATTATAAPTTAAPVACIDDSFEPNDGSNTATVLPPMIERSPLIRAPIACLNNADWFRSRFVDGPFHCNAAPFFETWDINARLSVFPGGNGTLRVRITDPNGISFASAAAGPGQTATATYRFSGSCNVDESRDFLFEVVTATGTDDLTYLLTLTNQPVQPASF